MDKDQVINQTKVVLAVMAKYHFWILSGVVTLLAFVVFFKASGDLATRFDEGKQRIEGKLANAQKVASEADPPNDKVVEAIREDTGKTKEDVLKAWTLLYNLQKEKNPWPEELGKNFLMMIKSLKPDESIPVMYLDLYWVFIRNHFKSLFDIIDVRHTVLLDSQGNEVDRTYDFGKPGAWGKTLEPPTGGEEYTQEVRGKVIWTKPEVLELDARWVSRPTSDQVRFAQEDLWVYEALLRIIRDTNAGATSYHNAAIKRIDAMNIGQAASAAFAGSSIGGGMGGGGGGDDLAMDPDDDGGGGMGGMSYFATAGMNTKEALLHGRYVGLNSEPLAADSTPPFREFNMMPVRLILLMDQRKIPDLLVNCANSSMPVEVRKVTIRPGQGGTIDLGTMATGYGGGGGGGEMDDLGMDDGSDMGGDEFGGGGFSGGGGSSPVIPGAALPDAVDVPVEIRGVIFIFNPPDRDKLGTGSAGGAPDETAAPLVPQRVPTVAAPGATPAAPGEPGPADTQPGVDPAKKTDDTPAKTGT